MNFAITGVGGFVAPRHLKAIKDTGHRLIAAADPHDAVGVLDKFAMDVRFFTEIERFDRCLEKLRRGPAEGRVHYVSVCSPNYLHDAHVRMALRAGASAICEKPLVINPWNLDALQQLERETGQTVATVLQLRLHPQLLALRRLYQEASHTRHAVSLTYVTTRGPWYDVSWKGDEARSGGLVTNIGVHLFDLVTWFFGAPLRSEVHVRQPRRAAGFLELEHADVRWGLSLDSRDLPPAVARDSQTTFRSIQVDGREVEFSDGFADLHTRVYEETLAGRPFTIDDARQSIELTYRIRRETVAAGAGPRHPIADGATVANVEPA